MRTHVVEGMVNTIEKIAEDVGLTEEEYMLALAFSMAILMEHKGSNLMDIDINELTLVVGLRKNGAGNPPVKEGNSSVH
ncbi:MULTISPECIES: hypothetical protein [Enterobacter]|jgi:predicted molibdopterin-dependent oxidoreductase YjgC|uniref:hypothetical protein n=1 Tax=Enterobacter TaxID=547 RepID=UPI000643BC7B|nr:MULTISPECIES: hypothetical protein [Enterobacter]KLQ28926.1 hypothetical protein ABR33_22470 [Enterobacter bugandensis]MBE3492919.1 hypothetical protein [Enterobacter cloacae complex sp. P12RS]MBE4945162.1 hypothetical protein [Enterobacter cloacae complex sp. P1B]MBE4971532.1 hypothetical protein [Enterobacter cloacae complex sp. P11RS]MBF2746972.1 hypothetical protein [Enterobacter bugandensis]